MTRHNLLEVEAAVVEVGVVRELARRHIIMRQCSGATSYVRVQTPYHTSGFRRHVMWVERALLHTTRHTSTRAPSSPEIAARHAYDRGSSRGATSSYDTDDPSSDVQGGGVERVPSATTRARAAIDRSDTRAAIDRSDG